MRDHRICRQHAIISIPSTLLNHPSTRGLKKKKTIKIPQLTATSTYSTTYLLFPLMCIIYNHLTTSLTPLTNILSASPLNINQTTQNQLSREIRVYLTRLCCGFHPSLQHYSHMIHFAENPGPYIYIYPCCSIYHGPPTLHRSYIHSTPTIL